MARNSNAGTGRAGRSRRWVIRAGASAGALALVGGARAADGPTDGAADRPAASDPVWARVISIHPRWYWASESVAESRRAMQDWLDMAAAAGINVLHAWVESTEAAAILGEPEYADRYPFWDPERWDAFDELITGAESRGMEVHLWYSFTRYKRGPSVPEYDRDLSVLPAGDPDWKSVRKAEYERGHTDPADPAVEGKALCNNEFAAHDWTFDLLERLFERYPRFRGLKVEEPGYLALDRCVCHRCQDAFAAHHGVDGERLLDHVYDSEDPYYEDDAAIPVKVRGTNEFVRRLSEWWERNSYGSALAFTSSWLSELDRIRGRNWVVWDREGLVPYYIPQTFAPSMDSFQWYLETAMEDLENGDVLPAVGIYFGWGENDPATVTAQIEAAHDHDGYAGTTVGGAALFSGGALTPELARRLRRDVYTAPAVPPWQDDEATDGGTGENATAELDALEPFTWNSHWGDPLPGSETVHRD